MAEAVGKDDIKEGREIDRFFISDTEMNLSNINYYGYLALEGDWYIMREDKTAGTYSAYRYVKGTVNYEIAWTNRASQSYLLYNLA